MIRKASSILLLFCAVYFFTLPIVFNSLFLAALASLVVGFVRIRQILASALMFRLYLTVFAWCVPIFTISVVYPVVHGSYDFSFLILAAKQAPYIVSALVVGAALAILARDKSVQSFVNCLLFVGAAQGCIVLAAVAFPAFREMLIPFQGAESPEFLTNKYNFGVRGFALSAQQFFGLASLLAVQTTIIFVYAVRAKVISLAFCVSVFLLGVACALVGRTSMLVFLAASIVWLVALVLSSRSRAKLVPVLVTLFVVSAVAQSSFDLSRYSGMLAWAFEPLVNLASGDGFKSESSDEMIQSMIFLPTGEQMLFGDGVYTSRGGEYYMGTDSGYMRGLLFSGIASLTAYLMYIGIFSKVSGLTNSRPKKLLNLVLVSVLVVISFLQVKGEVYLFGTMANVLITLFLSYVVSCECLNQKRLRKSAYLALRLQSAVAHDV